MAYSVQKSRLAKVAGVSLVLLLAACSSDSRYKRQVSGDEHYCRQRRLVNFTRQRGMILPVQVGDYNIPVATSTGNRQSPGHSSASPASGAGSAARVPSSAAIPRR